MACERRGFPNKPVFQAEHLFQRPVKAAEGGLFQGRGREDK